MLINWKSSVESNVQIILLSILLLLSGVKKEVKYVTVPTALMYVLVKVVKDYSYQADNDQKERDLKHLKAANSNLEMTVIQRDNELDGALKTIENQRLSYQQLETKLQQFNATLELKDSRYMDLKSLYEVEKDNVKKLFEKCELLSASVEYWQIKENELKQFEQSLDVANRELDLTIRNEELKIRETRLNLEKELTECNRTIEKQQDYIELLESNLRQLQNQANGVTVNKTVALITELLARKNINVELLKHDYSNGLEKLEFKPLSVYTDTAVKEACEQIKGFLDVDKSPTVMIKNGKISIILDTRNDLDRLNNQRLDLKKIAHDAFHFRINGQTGSGKSTLTNNLINAIEQSFECEETILIDPKYPMSEWTIDAKYQGIDNALNGLLDMVETLEDRLARATLDKQSNKPIRHFKPVLYVVDEIDWVIRTYGVKARDLLLTGLKVGRALNIKICYVGITPMCSDLSFKKSDFYNSCNIFLGENIRIGAKEISLTTQETEHLLDEFQLRITNGQKWLGLVKLPGQKGYLSQLPDVTEYDLSQPPQPLHSLSSSLPCDTTSQPQKTAFCPNCEVMRMYTKNGSIDGKPRGKCKQCNTTFNL